MDRLSLKNRLLIPFIFTFFAVLLFATYATFDYLFFAKKSESFLLDKANQKLESAESDLNGFVWRVEHLLLSIEQSGYVNEFYDGQLSESELQQIFKVLVASHPLIMQLRLLDSTGRERIRVDRNQLFQPAYIVPDTKLQDKSNRDYVRKNIGRTDDKVWFSPIDLNIEHGKVEVPYKPTLRAVLPVRDNGQFAGLLVVNLFVKELLNSMVDSSLYQVILVNGKGEYLTHYNPAKSWSSFTGKESNNFKQDFPKRAEKVLNQIRYRDKNLFAQQLNVPFSEKIFMVVQLNQAYLNEQFHAMLQRYAMLGLIVLIASMLLSLIFQGLFKKLGLDLKAVSRMERLFRNSFENAGVGVAHVSIKGEVVRANGKFMNIIGHDHRPILHEKIYDLIPEPPESSDGYRQPLLDQRCKVFQYQVRMPLMPEPVWLNVTASLVWHDNGLPAYFIVVIEDITEAKHNVEQINLFAMVSRNMAEAIVITDRQGRVIDVNEAYTDITGYEKSEALGEGYELIHPGDTAESVYHTIWQSVEQDGLWKGELWLERKNGEQYPAALRVAKFQSKDGAPPYYFGVFSDITIQKENEKYLKQIAHYDVLTGLPNRFLINKKLEKAMATIRAENGHLSVGFLDLDGFKEINDRYTHSVGDILLKTLAKRFQDVVGSKGSVARIGGDEFVIVIFHTEDNSEDFCLYRAIMDAAASPVPVDDAQLIVSTCLGITFYPQEMEVDAEQLIRQADKAMYEAKVLGKNQYTLFDDEKDLIARAFYQQVRDIREGLDTDQFELYYQPKIDLKRRHIIGFEALIRWNHPEKGLLSPGEFLGYAENSDLSILLDKWVIRHAFEQVRSWHKQGNSFSVSINVGATFLHSENLIDYLAKQLEAAPDIRPECIEIELLENVALKDIMKVTEVIHQLHGLGLKVSLDDFGTGYSSLQYLKKLPVDYLKIDQGFVRDMLDDPSDLAILKAVKGLADAFNIETIAEGIESHSAMEELIQLGIDHGQGYVIARPMMSERVLEWVQCFQKNPEKGCEKAVS